MTPLTDHQVLVFLVQLGLLVGLARILGGLAKRLGQPAVVGELLAGVVLGPSVFKQLWPTAHHWVFLAEPRVSSATFAFSWLGVVFLLVVLGLETDLAIVSRFRKASLAAAAGSLLLPMVVTGALGFALAAEFRADDAPDWVVAGFFALALSVSALPVVGKILHELGLIRRNFGQITIAAAMAKDAVGWLLLALLTGVAFGGIDTARIVASFAGLAVFVVAALTLGRWLLDAITKQVLARGADTTVGVSIVVVAALAGAAVTQALHVEAILGAYLAGLVLSLSRYRVPGARRHLETMTAAFFAPVFFAYSGLRVDITILGEGRIALYALAATVLAVVSKVAGSMLGARLAGLSPGEGRALGAGLTPLGIMGVVVAIIGLNAGVLNERAYTVLVLVAVVTSLLTPAMLRLAVRHLPPDAEESARLERESLVDESVILGVNRILIPTRGGTNTLYASRLAARVFDKAEFTILAVDVVGTRRPWRRRQVGSTTDPAEVMKAVEGSRVRLLRRVARDPADAIALESRLGYDLVVMGASGLAEASPLGGSTVVDRVMARSHVPVVIVSTPPGHEPGAGPPQQILVPVTASRSTRAAEEFAYSAARATRGSVTAIHVINRPDGTTAFGAVPGLTNTDEIGEELADRAREFGSRLGVEVGTAIRRAFSAEQEIMEFAAEHGVDLLVLGASARPLTRMPFFGHRISYMLANAACPVVVIALPVS